MIDTLAADLAADLVADLAPDRATDLVEELRWTGRPDCAEPDWDEFDLSMDQWLNRSIDDFCRQLAAAPTARMGRDQIDRIAALERLRAVTAAAQTAEEVAFATQQRAEQLAAGVTARNLGRGITEQIGFARRISPAAAAFHLGTGTALTQRLPAALAQLRRGAISEAQCQILATKTSHLTAADAAIVDAATAERMDGWNLRQTEQGVQHAAYAIDPRGFVDRRGRAEADRRVWTRPAPDCMAIVSALLPAAQGVAVYAHLNAAARTVRGQGDARTPGQLMADTLVERTTGQSAAHLVPIEVNLTITEDSLFDNGDTPAWLQDYGPLPAEHARAVIAASHPSRLNRRPGRMSCLHCPLLRPPNGSAPRPGSGGSLPTRSPVSPPTSTAGTGNSTASPDNSSPCEIGAAVSSIAPPRYDTRITWYRSVGVARPASTTVRDSANAATTPKTCPAGIPAQAIDLAKSSPPHRPGTVTAPSHHPRSAYPPARSENDAPPRSGDDSGQAGLQRGHQFAQGT